MRLCSSPGLPAFTVLNGLMQLPRLAAVAENAALAAGEVGAVNARGHICKN